MAKERLTREEFQKKREEMIKEPGTFVVRGLSLECRALITKMNEYDTLVNFIKRRVGRPGNDQQKIISLIEQCVAFETGFRDLVTELRGFVNTLKGDNKSVPSNGNGNGSKSDSEKV